MEEGATNPFKVESHTERLLVFREKQRELEKLESIKQKIEHKYMHGANLMQALARPLRPGVSADQGDPTLSYDRTGMIRQVSNIEAMPIPPEKYHSLNSHTEKIGHHRAKALTLGSTELLASLTKATQNYQSPRSPQGQPDDHSLSVIKSGKARFKTPAPQRDRSPTEDTLRYLKVGNGKTDSIKDYIQSSRHMLRSNITMLENQEEISKLQLMITDEESKLTQAE